MKHAKIISRTFAVLASTVLALALAAPASSAASPAPVATATSGVGTSDMSIMSDSCSFGGRACFYRHATYPTNSERRIVQVFQDLWPSYTSFNWDGTSSHMNDQLTSLQGHLSGTICLFEHSSGGGRGLCLGAGVWPSNLGNHNFNDITSSHIW